MRRLRGVWIAVALLTVITGARADEPQDPPPPACERFSCYDPLFTVQYPHTHSFVTSSNIRVPLPVHYYDWEVAIVFGEGDLSVMETLTAGTPYRPIRTESNTGVAALATISYLDSDIAPYREAILMFPVKEDAVTIADGPGSMLAAILDPANRLWTVMLILDEQLPIDAGREYLFIPKEPDPKLLAMELGSDRVTFEFAEPNGTPIASGDVGFDPLSVIEPAGQLGTAPGTRGLAGELLRLGGNLRLRFVFRNIEQPNQIARLTGVAHATDPISARIATCCTGGIVVNEQTPFGAALASLHLQPRGIVGAKGLRAVLDIDL